MSKRQELIIVVVPVYNVERYVSKCIDSIIKQTYSNFELILIDDGSPDNSGKICDEYAKIDNRIRVIHQENKGLAEVRNVGIKESKGDFLQFVDSDDWIEPDTLEICINIADKYDADIVCFRAIKAYLDGREVHTSGKKYGIRIMDMPEALSNVFFSKFVDVISWNKLIRTSLLHEITYPRGILYEDMFTTYKIIAKASKVACTDKELYHYLQNPQSIGHYEFSEKTYDLGRAAEECYSFSSKIEGADKNALLVGMWYWKIAVVNRMIRANSMNRSYMDSLRRDIRIGNVLSCTMLPMTKKSQLAIFKISPTVYRFIFNIHEKKENNA